MSLTILEFSTTFKKDLNAIYDVREIDSLLYLLLNHYLGFSKIDLAVRKEEIIDNNNTIKLLEAATKLKTYQPIQQIIGKTEFYGFYFIINEHVLIPRQETEELVRWVERDLINKSIKVIDICTGSGCIGISLKKLSPQLEVELLDVSTEALNIARKNAALNSVDVLITTLDILNEIPTSKYDVIVSNPPYVKLSEKLLMNKNVLDFEPHLALFVEDDNPLLFYERIASLGLKILNTSGFIYFEINEALGNEIITLLQNLGYINITLRKDLNGKDRMIKCQK